MPNRKGQGSAMQHAGLAAWLLLLPGTKGKTNSPEQSIRPAAENFGIE
jgi:hypothetical protein